MTTPTIKLNSGYEMPVLGIGCYILTPEEAENSVYHALKDGYRLIDTANVYMNERGVGRGMKRAIDEGICTREEIFLTTKLWPSEYEDVESAIKDTLARLNTEYVDLLLLHQSVGNYIAGYQGMEKAVEAGTVKSIGLSNFYQEKFQKVLDVAKIKPAVLQNETHPFWQGNDMKEFMKDTGTVLEAWFPLGGRENTSDIFGDATIQEIAKAHGKTPAQTVLRWHYQAGNIAIPGSADENEIAENIEIFDFELSADEMTKIAELDGKMRFFTMSEEQQESQFTAWAPDFNNQK